MTPAKRSAASGEDDAGDLAVMIDARTQALVDRAVLAVDRHELGACGGAQRLHHRRAGDEALLVGQREPFTELQSAHRNREAGESDDAVDDHVSIVRHDSWSKFEEWRAAHSYRLLLFTTKAATDYRDFHYQTSDILLFGRESAGVTDAVVEAADARLVIPISPGLRSLNVAMTAAMAAGEALRQVRNPHD